MSDYQHIVDQIRTFLAGADQTLSPELADLASQYASLCKEANERLRRCVDLLRRGLRSEAIHTADEPPALLDIVNALDIPEGVDWENIAAIYGLARPPKLLIAAAQELNEAYSTEQPLKTLLARHRRLALAHAPLNDRLTVMRELAGLDPTSVFWEDDIQAFETVRARELTAQANTAIRNRTRDQLEELRLEIENTAWRIELKPDLIRGIQNCLAQARHEEIISRIQPKLDDLDTAYMAGDATTAASILDEIGRLGAESTLSLPEDIQGRLRPVQEWLEGEWQRERQLRTFERACAHLTQGLDADLPTEELSARAAAVRATEFELPDELSSRLRSLVRRREQAVRTRRKLAIGSIAAAIVFLIVLTGWIIQRKATESAAQQAISHFSDLVVNEKLAEAEAFYAKMQQESRLLVERSEIRTFHSLLAEKIEKEKERAAEFKAHLTAAMAGGPENPNTQELDQAEWKSRSSSEKLEVLDFKAKIAAVNKDKSAKVQADARKVLSELKAELDRLESSGEVKDGAADVTKLEAGEKALVDMSSVRGLDAALKGEIEQQATRAAELRKQLVAATAEKSDFERTVKGGISAGEYREAVAKFQAKYPQSQRTTWFKRAIEDIIAWEAADNWAAMMKNGPRPLTPPATTLGDLVKVIDAYREKCGQGPFASAAQEYLDYLARAQVALANDGPWKGQFRTMLTLPLLCETRCVGVKDVGVYYLPARGKWDVKLLNDQPFKVQFEAILTGDIARTATITEEYRNLVKDVPAASPQSALAAEMSKVLDELKEDNWEVFPFQIIQIIQGAKQVDPILRAMLIDRVIRPTDKAGWNLGDSLTKYSEVLSPLSVDDIAWMNPKDTTANRVREQAKATLDKLMPLTAVQASIVEQRKKLAAKLDWSVANHGILLRQENSWKLAMPERPAEGVKLFVTGRGGRTVQEIGVVRGGITVWTEANMIGLPEGTLVFIVEPRK